MEFTAAKAGPSAVGRVLLWTFETLNRALAVSVALNGNQTARVLTTACH